MSYQPKILEIGNYPPPLCGWAMETKLVVEELRRRGSRCDILKINENRQIKSPDYTDVQNGLDYVLKIIRFARQGYKFHMHVNGDSRKGYGLALLAVAVGRMAGNPALLTFHGGYPQTFFPRPRRSLVHWAFKLLFSLAGGIRCDSSEIKRAIEYYGIPPSKVRAIAAFSPQYLNTRRVELEPEIERFLRGHHPVFFCYVSFRPEYRLDTLTEAMRRFRRHYANAGFIWLGFPEKELLPARQFAANWSEEERDSLLLLGNLDHDRFLTLLGRSFASIRTPACDGVSASVLEALAMGIPVVASENGRRPAGVITYQERDPADLVAKLEDIVERRASLQRISTAVVENDNVRLIADWLQFCPRPMGGNESSSEIPETPVASGP